MAPNLRAWQDRYKAGYLKRREISEMGVVTFWMVLLALLLGAALWVTDRHRYQVEATPAAYHVDRERLVRSWDGYDVGVTAAGELAQRFHGK